MQQVGGNSALQLVFTMGDELQSETDGSVTHTSKCQPLYGLYRVERAVITHKVMQSPASGLTFEFYGSTFCSFTGRFFPSLSP